MVEKIILKIGIWIFVQPSKDAFEVHMQKIKDYGQNDSNKKGKIPI